MPLRACGGLTTAKSGETEVELSQECRLDSVMVMTEESGEWRIVPFQNILFLAPAARQGGR